MNDAERRLMVDFMDHVLTVLHGIYNKDYSPNHACYFTHKQTSGTCCRHCVHGYEPKQTAASLEHSEWLRKNLFESPEKS